jgi:hypothetical protein
MDIEGAEKDVFTSNYESWLPKVKVMIVELHGQGARDAFYNAVKDENFVKFEQGENLVCIRPAGRTEQPCG